MSISNFLFVSHQGEGQHKYRTGYTGLYLIVFVKDALEEEVGIMVELSSAVWGNFQPREGEITFIHI